MAKKPAKKKISPKELERMWKSIDLRRFWGKVTERISPAMDAYSRARALSRGGAQRVLF